MQLFLWSVLPALAEVLLHGAPIQSPGLSESEDFGFKLLSGCRSVEEGPEKLPRGPIVVPFWGSYIESYKVIPKRNYLGFRAARLKVYVVGLRFGPLGSFRPKP